MGKFLELLGVDRAGIQQPPITILPLADRIHLGLQPGDFGVDVLRSDTENGDPVGGAALISLQTVAALLLGQVRGLMGEPGQFGINLGQLQQRNLL